jgi:spore coat protein U-like protein
MTLSRGQTTRTDTNTIAAAVPAGTVPASGAYGDTVIATIVFR